MAHFEKPTVSGPSKPVKMSDGGGGDDGGTMEVSAAVQTVADVSVLQKHIRKLVPLLLEDGGEVPGSLETALEEKSSVEQMKKFLSDPQIYTVLVERSTLKGLCYCSSNLYVTIKVMAFHITKSIVMQLSVSPIKPS